MYVDDRNINQVYDLVGGFLLAKHGNNILSGSDRHFLEHFNSWVAGHLGMSSVTNWKKMILKHSKATKLNPFELMMSLCDEFFSSKKLD